MKPSRDYSSHDGADGNDGTKDRKRQHGSKAEAECQAKVGKKSTKKVSSKGEPRHTHIPSLNNLCKWTIAPRDVSETTQLKLKLKKVPKSPTPAKSASNIKFLKTLKGGRSDNSTKVSGVVKVNTKKYKSTFSGDGSVVTKTPETVHVGRPQPFRESGKPFVSSKTGQVISDSRQGKLFMVKKN